MKNNHRGLLPDSTCAELSVSLFVIFHNKFDVNMFYGISPEFIFDISLFKHVLIKYHFS